MKTILSLVLALVSTFSYAQSAVGSVNSGATQTTGMIYSVGEIFVLPVSDPDQVSSGTIGILSRIEFLTTGIDETLTADWLKAYPNPATNAVCLETNAATPVGAIYIYDASGKEVLVQKGAVKSIDMSSLGAGTYFIKTDLNNTTLKITKN